MRTASQILNAASQILNGQMSAGLLALMLTSGFAIGQDAPSPVLRPLLGKVVDTEGNGLAEAEVHLSFSPVGVTATETTQHQVATTDARGRFRFQALPCTKHLIWAIGKPDDEGKRVVSTIRWIAPGRPFELVADQPHSPSTLTISGLDTWKDYAPFSVQIAPGGIPIPGMTLALDEGGKCDLPPLPVGTTSVVVHDKHDRPLSTHSCSPGRSTRQALAPMQQMPLKVVDEQGNGIAGVTIRQRLRGYGLPDNELAPYLPSRQLWRDHGTTDENGKLVVPVATRKDPFEITTWQGLFFTASKDGLTTSHSGISRMPFVDGKQVQREGMKELTFTLKPAKPTKLRLMRTQETPLRNQPVTIKSGIKVHEIDNNGYTHESLVLNLRTDEDGVVSIPALTEPIPGMQIVLGGAGLTAFVPEPLRRMTPYRAITLHALKAKPGTQHEVSLQQTAKVRLQMLTEHGSPATDAQLMLISRANAKECSCDGWNTMATTDSAGRVAFLLEPGRWSVFARTKTGMAHLKLNLEDGETAEHKLDIQPMTTMRGRVVDENGKPVANVRLNCHSSSWHSVGNRDPILEQIAQSMNWSWIGGTRTNENGEFACAFLDLDGMTYEGRFQKGKKKSSDFRIIPNEEPETIVIK